MSDAKRRGRPRIPIEQRPVTVHVKLSAELYDWVSRVSVRRDEAVNAVVRKLVERAAHADEAGG